MSRLITLLDSFERPEFYDEDFFPFGSPEDLLKVGVFMGQYFDDLPDEVQGMDIATNNLFCVPASKSREYWVERNWIHPQDPLGWFQWYLRFYRGRRTADDHRQIKRWRNFNSRHGGAVRKLGMGDLSKRPKQRQCLLHWACNPVPDLISM